LSAARLTRRAANPLESGTEIAVMGAL
jgi:hypothetical protein